MSVELPNVRKLFIPDKGYVIFDADLKGADAQVVAAEAEDEDLLNAFREGLDVHDKNARDVWGNEYTSLSGYAKDKKRKENKQAVHGTNYGASARTLAVILGWSIRQAEFFQRNWFHRHPGIKEWHRRTEHQLQTSRSVSNKFGYQISYFDRISALLPQALAWVPQSTVALTCFKGAVQLDKYCPWAQVLLQVHDSLVFQVPFARAESYREILDVLQVPIPYSPPLIIPWGLKKSEKSWGDCEKVQVD